MLVNNGYNVGNAIFTTHLRKFIPHKKMVMTGGWCNI